MKTKNVGNTKFLKNVQVNSKVTVSINDMIRTITLVQTKDLKLEENKISTESPLGKALLNRGLNDIVEITAPAGLIRCKIIGIEFG